MTWRIASVLLLGMIFSAVVSSTIRALGFQPFLLFIAGIGAWGLWDAYESAALSRDSGSDSPFDRIWK